mmetsp:Transcript_42384/g.90183  ORF Transcript_42384/g.90183 Transcript_42384/m.90183 type:complete len:222 (-) Transcript_42384:531-1196(-)|eukprot:CAMPEP_0172527086 /NCGR_PEP_ID=MMETSP1067-20121228/1856_1 /TAXON_ID=265564 ORGANISM="Thalassiosira punctigera, Strain Tpunct2005C2" /NCGR_SAMPLE_ID=MMETSP1067 /ASSEMBLY_ACC=CAM_ASM_000444 /LENGTH=221 /DNA_ID=CAMNT_0013310751 /DNA_START=68 /DNA_END=733 /DNA_ORIENTATION=+
MEGNKDSDDSYARENSSSSPVSQGVNNNNGGNDGASSDAECSGPKFKCRLCLKRLGRRNCPHQACVKCCTDPLCEPHREARSLLAKKESILDGTDWITRTAAAKRASRVSPGAFFDSDIRYFGETVVIWDINEFMEVPKWREDAMRRSRNRKDGHLELSDLGGAKRRKVKEEEGLTAAPATVEEGKEGIRKKKLLSRKKRFENVCDELYRKLSSDERNQFT